MEDALALPEPLKDAPPEGDSRVAEALPVKSRALCDTVGEEETLGGEEGKGVAEREKTEDGEESWVRVGEDTHDSVPRRDLERYAEKEAIGEIVLPPDGVCSPLPLPSRLGAAEGVEPGDKLGLAEGQKIGELEVEPVIEGEDEIEGEGECPELTDAVKHPVPVDDWEAQEVEEEVAMEEAVIGEEVGLGVSVCGAVSVATEREGVGDRL